jgi:hypothetical protein
MPYKHIVLNIRRKKMTLQAYLDNIEAKTGKTPEDFRVLAEKQGLLREGVKTGEIVSWLKEDFGLGHGHAMAIVLTLKSATQPRLSRDEQVAKHFNGDKARWRQSYDELMTPVSRFGSDITVAPTNSYISILRQGKKIAIIQVTSDRLDVGIKLKGVKTTELFKAAGDWNGMVTHRVRISDPKQIDPEVLTWLKNAYDEALSAKARVTAG